MTKDTHITQHLDRLKANFTLILIILLLASGVAAAQSSNPICASADGDTDNNLGIMATLTNGIIQLAFYGGLIGSVITYFGTQGIEAAPVGEQRREQLKGLRRKSFGASVKLLIGGPVIYFLLNGLVGLSCISIIPF